MNGVKRVNRFGACSALSCLQAQIRKQAMLPTFVIVHTGLNSESHTTL